MLKIFQINGNSLFPLFEDKSLVLCLKSKNFKTGDIAVFTHQTHGFMIKKIDHIKNDKYYMLGTSADSIDSRDFGYVEKNELKYRVLFKIF